MSLSQSELLRRFTEDNATEGKASNMFIEEDTVYSYGHHFPLLVRWNNGYLLNADKYSPTTSQHQSMCFSIADLQIPFSTLEDALLNNLNKLNLVDKEEARWDKTGRYIVDTKYQPLKNIKGIGKTVTKRELDTLYLIAYFTNLKMGVVEDEERRPQGAVLEYNGNYYLSSMDGENYFLAKLPEKVETVSEAFQSLIPLEMVGKDYERQGEWFFTPIDMKKPKSNIQKWRYLSPKNGTAHHSARDCILEIGYKYPLVRGTIRHDNKDHRMLRLGEIWHMAIESRHLESWGAQGRVD